MNATERHRRVVRLDNDHLLVGAIKLVSRVLGNDYEDDLRRYALDPSYRIQNTFLVISGGEVVSHLRLVPREMRIGRSLLRVAILADLVTAPEHEGHGHARTALDAALEVARGERYHLALLFSDLNKFFQNQGWTQWCRPTFTFDIHADNVVDVPDCVRAYKPSDFGPMMAIHGFCGSSYSGPLLRSVAWWKSDLQRYVNGGDVLVVEKQGTITGYARVRHNWPNERDSTITDLLAMGQVDECGLTSAVIRRAVQHGSVRIIGSGPLASRLEDLLPSNQGPCVIGKDLRTLLKVVNLRRLIRNLVPEFEAIGFSGNGCRGESINIAVSNMAAEISCNGGRFDVKAPSSEQPSFLQLTEGDFFHLLFEGIVPLTGSVLNTDWIRAIFPKREFAFWGGDEV